MSRHVRVKNENGQWVTIAGVWGSSGEAAGRGGTVYRQAEEPEDPQPGDIWIDEEPSPGGSGGGSGINIFQQFEEPDDQPGDLWFVMSAEGGSLGDIIGDEEEGDNDVLISPNGVEWEKAIDDVGNVQWKPRYRWRSPQILQNPLSQNGDWSVKPEYQNVNLTFTAGDATSNPLNFWASQGYEFGNNMQNGQLGENWKVAFIGGPGQGYYFEVSYTNNEAVEATGSQVATDGESVHP